MFINSSIKNITPKLRSIKELNLDTYHVIKHKYLQNLVFDKSEELTSCKVDKVVYFEKPDGTVLCVEDTYSEPEDSYHSFFSKIGMHYNYTVYIFKRIQDKDSIPLFDEDNLHHKWNYIISFNPAEPKPAVISQSRFPKYSFQSKERVVKIREKEFFKLENKKLRLILRSIQKSQGKIAVMLFFTFKSFSTICWIRHLS